MKAILTIPLWVTSIFAANIATREAKQEASCSSFLGYLPSLSKDVTVNSSVYIPTDSLVISDVPQNNSRPFCRVTGAIKYGDLSESQSTLNFELWLPDSDNYTGRYLSVGNGGFAGVIDYAAMVENLGKGYAVAGGDSGHTLDDNGASTAPGVYIPFFHNKDQVLAWIRNSIALFTVPSRELTNTYYGNNVTYSYYKGCSTGGGQGFALALLYPDLFDGIVAGSPGFDYSHLMILFLYNYLQTLDSGLIDQSGLDLITNAVLSECDALDGVEDNIIEDPLKCNFNISTLQCTSGASSIVKNETVCLTPDQITTAKALYTGPINTLTSSSIYPGGGFSLGSESQWLEEETTLANSYAVPLFQNLVFDDLTWNGSTFNFGSDVNTVDQNAGQYIDHTNANLSVFRNAGGKMLMTQGWTDPLNPALGPIEHLGEIQDLVGGDMGNWLRLFMVPGGGHCGAVNSTSNVPSTYATLEALNAWVENGTAPSYVVSSNPPNGDDRTRRLCPWPETANFLGGNPDNYTSFECSNSTATNSTGTTTTASSGIATSTVIFSAAGAPMATGNARLIVGGAAAFGIAFGI